MNITPSVFTNMMIVNGHLIPKDHLKNLKKQTFSAGIDDQLLKMKKANVRKIYCAECGDLIMNYCYTIGDNFLQVRYFDDPEGLDNVFCSQECLCKSLSVRFVSGDDYWREFH